MTSVEIRALLPMAWVAGSSILLLLLTGFRRSARVALGLALAGFTGGLAFLPLALEAAPAGATDLLVVDGFAIFFQALFLVAGAVLAVLAHDYLKRLEVIRSEELMALLLLSVVGAMALAAARHLTALFLGLEILSIGLYGMVAYLHDGELGVEAGIKYLVLAGASSGFLLFGMGTLYLEGGTMSLQELSAVIVGAGWNVRILAGSALVTAGIGFKLAVVPFHLWTPDVYQAAPAPVTAFLATVSKIAVLAVLLRLVTWMPAFPETPLWSGIAALAMASMLAGNLLALRQEDLKRILAYSSIAHMGYLLVPVLAGGQDGVPAAAFYAAAYAVTTLAAFGTIAALSQGEEEEGRLDRFRGLWRTRPFSALILGSALFSLAGIPLTAGFVGKFYLLEAGLGMDLWALALVLAGTSVIGLFYYLRVVAALFAQEGKDAGIPKRAERRTVGSGTFRNPDLATAITLALLLLILVGLGVWPGPFLDLIQGSAVLAGG